MSAWREPIDMYFISTLCKTAVMRCFIIDETYKSFHVKEPQIDAQWTTNLS